MPNMTRIYAAASSLRKSICTARQMRSKSKKYRTFAIANPRYVCYSVCKRRIQPRVKYQIQQKRKLKGLSFMYPKSIFQVNGKPFYPIGVQAHNNSGYTMEQLGTRMGGMPPHQLQLLRHSRGMGAHRARGGPVRSGHSAPDSQGRPRARSQAGDTMVRHLEKRPHEVCAALGQGGP